MNLIVGELFAYLAKKKTKMADFRNGKILNR